MFLKKFTNFTGKYLRWSLFLIQVYWKANAGVFLWNLWNFYKHHKQPPKGVPRKSVLKICSKFIGEHPCRSAISIKLLCNFIEIAFRQWCSPVNLLYIFKTPFPKNTSGWLLLEHLFLQNTCGGCFWIMVAIKHLLKKTTKPLPRRLKCCFSDMGP